MKTGRKIQHGHSTRLQGKTKEYIAWNHMKSRCYQPSNASYHKYGGRGIIVCERWLNSFENFFADMGPAPSKDHSLDRIDVNGNYEPGNCKWSDPIEQARNTRRNKMIEYNGENRCVAEWAEIKGLRYSCLMTRIREGWDIDKAINTPTRRKVPQRNPNSSNADGLINKTTDKQQKTNG